MENVGGGKQFDVARFSPEVGRAIRDGMADAWQALGEARKEMDAGRITSGDCFGTRQYLKNNYLYRMLAAVVGIFGNSKEEAMDKQSNWLPASGGPFVCALRLYWPKEQALTGKWKSPPMEREQSLQPTGCTRLIRMHNGNNGMA